MSLSNASEPAASCPAMTHHPRSLQSTEQRFVERRSAEASDLGRGERRQFGSSHAGLSDQGHELALAIDEYKVQHHRRYLTCDEMLKVLSSLGYVKQSCLT
jgi:hypothetical protein